MPYTAQAHTAELRREQMEELVIYPLDWLEERSGLVGGVRYFLFRNVPCDINWMQTLGSAALTAFLVQAITGVILAMYYEPSAATTRHGLPVARVDPEHHRPPDAWAGSCAACTAGARASSSSSCSCTWGASSCSAPTSTRAS